MANKVKDLRRKRFGRLVAINRVYQNKTSYYQCVCDCGNIDVLVRRNRLVDGETQSCGCLAIEKTIERSWKGHEEISGKYWYDLNRNAKYRLIEFSITIENAWEKFVEQGKQCYFTGETLCFAKGKKDKTTQTASLDRLDNSLGYTKENCCWVHKTVNRLKNDFVVDEFLLWCKKITEYNHDKAEVQSSAPDRA